VGFAGDAASIANSSGGHRNEQAGRLARIEAKSERPTHPTRQFFLFEKSPRGGSRSRTGFAERHPRLPKQDIGNVLVRFVIHAYRVKGQYLNVSGRPKDAVRALDPGLVIDPNAAGLLATRSTSNDYLGRFQQAKSDIQQAMLLSPRDPAMTQCFNLRTDPELGLGRFDEARKDVKKAIDGG
jgi:hypothetical protein